jgi:parvulin-like peptidyl-prolyl isomerase
LLKKWLREPLLHFLLIGAALFIFYNLQTDDSADDSNSIVISESDIDRLITLWEKKWQRLPTETELEGLVEAQIREEVLYREALAMGLDQNDTIVRRRLAQKVEFISADLASQAEPSDADLQTYLDTHAEKFAVPARISFQQIYLNADQRGDQVNKDAQRLLGQLTRSAASVDIMAAGDSFMFGQQHEQLTEHGVSRLFGQQFAEKIFELPVGAWHGPVVSGYGLHLVYVDAKSEAKASTLDEVRNKVRDEWLAQQRRKLDQVFYSELRKRYDIVVQPVAK